MTKAHLKTRTATTSSVSSTAASGSALTHAELDSNLINLRDSSWGLGDDSSTVIQVDDGNTITVAGGSNITTAVSGTTLTITGATPAITALNNATANELVSVGATTTELDAESGLTYDGSTLAATGNITATGAITTSGDASDISTDTISIDSGSATISGLRSNEDLNLQANGTGLIVISANSGTFSNWSTESRYNGSNNMYYEDLTHTIANDRLYSNNMLTKIKLDSGQRTNNSNDRWRQYAFIEFDLNGSAINATSSYLSRGPMALANECLLTNTSANDSEIGNASGVQTGVNIKTESTGDMSFNAMNPDSSTTNAGTAAYTSWMDINPNSGSTISIPNAYQYYATGVSTGGSGTSAITNSYAFYANTNSGASDITNEYAFYAEDADALSAVGKLESYREKITALTSSTTVNVDCSLGPTFTITLGHNTTFNIKNLGTGQTCSIIITQDGTGDRTGAFGTEGSSAVKFAGGTPTLTTTATTGIDIVSITNDGTNYLGNIAKAYAA